VVDISNHSVKKFNSKGKFIAKWPGVGPEYGSLSEPSDITTDLSGNVYVADSGHHRILKFDSNGKLLSKWGALGIDDGNFTSSRGLALIVDSSGTVYVADSGNDRIQMFKKINGTTVVK